jgi:hypothetical protein
MTDESRRRVVQEGPVVEEENSAERAERPRRWPGLQITAAVRMAFDARKILIAAAGLLLLQLGWSLLDLAFLGSVGVTPDVLQRGPAVDPANTLSWSTETIDRLTRRLFEPARVLTTPLAALFAPRSPWLTMLHALLGVAWLIVVWGLCGGAIARIAVVQEARSRQTGIGEAVRFAWRAAPSLILTPFCPLMAIAFCALTGLFLGWIYRLPAGGAVVGALLFIPMAVGLVMTLLLAALVAGWPLFHAALAAGADDALDALSRTYGYLSQRLVQLAVGVAIAWACGIAGLALVDLLASGVVRLTQWSLSLSGPGPTIATLFSTNSLNQDRAAVATHRFWLGAVRLLAHAWVFSYFWTAAAMLYLWLRNEVDGTPTSVIDPPAAALSAPIAPGQSGPEDPIRP